MKYNLSKIRTKRAYTVNEIGRLLNANRRTVYRWIKEGLPLLDPIKKAKLIMGHDLKAFIVAKREARKVKLQPDEFFCFTCKKAVKAKRGSKRIEKTGKKIGKPERDQEIFCGKCKECNGNIARLI